MLRIFLPLYLVLFIFSVSHEKLFDSVLIWLNPDAVNEDSLGDLAGAFYLVEEVLVLSPKEEWPDKLQRMQAPNIPILLRPRNTYPLSTEDHALLDEGVPVVVDTASTLVIKAFGETDQVIQIGPVDTVDAYDEGMLVTLLSGSGVLIMCVVLWTLTVQRRIRHLSGVAARFGDGDLSIRASEKNSLRVSDLNRSFNVMADRIQQLVESHKHLSNAVSHELRTPVSRIKFELDYAADLDQPDELKAALDSIADDVDELEDLVAEALDYARYERTGLELQRDAQDITLWLRSWYENTTLPSEVLTLVFQLDPASERGATLCEFHSSSMKRALDNLVLNAARYARQYIRVTQCVYPERIMIRIEDDGPGIEEQLWDTLFEPFVRAETSRSKDTGGYGLGLAIVKQIMLRHQGDVRIRHSDLGGACFELSWPVCAEPVS